jgi:hypothetical protein
MLTDNELENSMDQATNNAILSPQQFGDLADTVIRRLQRSMEEVAERRLTCTFPRPRSSPDCGNSRFPRLAPIRTRSWLRRST